MNEIMNWITQYNSLIIQIGFTIVLILIVVYVYRLFFSPTVADTIAQEANLELSEVSQKLNQILNQQNSNQAMPQATQKESQQAPSDPKANYGIETVERMKAEILQLQQKLNESEKKVFELTPTSGNSSQNDKASIANSTEAAFNVIQGSNDQSAQQIAELNKKMENLQARLSEYDIIADDIAELSQLRAENAELKSKLSNSQVEAVSPNMEVASVVSEIPSLESELAVDPMIAEIEKNLLNDFEKSTQKGS